MLELPTRGIRLLFQLDKRKGGDGQPFDHRLATGEDLAHSGEEILDLFKTFMLDNVHGAEFLALFGSCPPMTFAMVDQNAVASIKDLVALILILDSHCVPFGQKDLVRVCTLFDCYWFITDGANRVLAWLATFVIDFDFEITPERM